MSPSPPPYLPETQAIIQTVQSTTGATVEVIMDPSLAVQSTASMADRGASVHLIRVSQSPPDYFIACQCGFILRHYAHPSGQRKGLAATALGRSAVRKHVLAPDGIAARRGLPEDAAQELARQFVDSLGTQLRSVPLGLRVDQWIHGTYPGLRALQARAFDEQQKLNAQSIGLKVREIAPAVVFQANAAMNAAFALFCDEIVGRQLYTQPYRAIGVEAKGRHLLDLAAAGPSGPLHDYELVSAWAAELGIGDWYEWVPLP